MTSNYCLLYKTANRLYVCHAILTDYLLFINGVNNKNVFPNTMLINEIMIDEIVQQTFLDPCVSFMTNITRDTFLYQKLKVLLPSTPTIIKDLSLEQLDISRHKLVDCLIGENLRFDTKPHKARVFQYLDHDEINPYLLPYLHLIHYTKVQPINWLRELVYLL
jgi:hypothetical protein